MLLDHEHEALQPSKYLVVAAVPDSVGGAGRGVQALLAPHGAGAGPWGGTGGGGGGG